MVRAGHRRLRPQRHARGVAALLRGRCRTHRGRRAGRAGAHRPAGSKASQGGDRRAGGRSRRALRAEQLTARRLAPLIIAALIVVAAGLLTGVYDDFLPRTPLCTVGDTVTECGSVTGIVLRVDGAGAADVTGFALRSTDSRSIDFAVGRLDLRDGGLPAPHLREHLRDGQPIIVDYALEEGRYVALRYIDAP
jgi:hypothetical protein